ncbi:MAG: ABC transporter substrate-binding protein, partial [Gemmobacter sp.]
MKKLMSLCTTAVLSALLGSAALAEGSLYFGLSGEPRTLDTKVNAGATARTIRLAIHRGLLNYGTAGDLSHELAEGYEVSADALTYTFRLREAQFHDGAPVTAADVKATLESLTAEGSTATYKAELSVIDTITTPDDRTVVITLEKPFV